MKNPYPRIQLVCFAATTCFAFASVALAVDPPPDGGYANFNTAEGQDALFSLTSGISNTAVGYDSLYFNTEGTNNTAIGTVALANNTTGSANTANGDHALSSNTEGFFNTATGISALGTNTTGNSNTANGAQALWFNLTGSDNTATGSGALQSNTTGSRNTATGEGSLLQNTTGDENSATGFDALLFNTAGAGNTAAGFGALHNNSTGNNNTATGVNSLFNNSTGSSNIAVGRLAGASLTTGSANIDIGNTGVAGESKTIRIGDKSAQTATFIAGINGTIVAGGVGVIINTNGRLGTVVSSERYKDGIKPMDKASESILALSPVTFRYKKELDPDGIPQFGLVAEQVEKVNPDLVARDEQGKPYTVRYEAVNAMLLNEFLKAHRKIDEQEASLGELKSSLAQQQKDFQSAIAEQRRANEALTALVKAQAAQIQKVSDQLRTQAPAPRVVAND